MIVITISIASCRVVENLFLKLLLIGIRVSLEYCIYTYRKQQHYEGPPYLIPVLDEGRLS